MSNTHEEINIVEQQQSQGIINSSQEKEKKMSIGSSKSRAQREAMEDLYKGSVQDIKEGCMITVLADGDPNGYPFWVAKALKVFTENEDVTSVYATNTHPFNGVYKLEMVIDKKKMVEREKERVRI